MLVSRIEIGTLAIQESPGSKGVMDRHRKSPGVFYLAWEATRVQ